MWSAIADAGFLELMAPEEAGGAGLDLAGVLPILTAIGYHAVPLPVGQAIALRALIPAGRSLPGLLSDGLPTLAPALGHAPDGRLVTPRVPYDALADQVLIQAGRTLRLLDARHATRSPCGIHREPTADLYWPSAILDDDGATLWSGPAAEGGVAAWGAALHAALICGALTRSVDMTLQYGNERSQFGRSIGRFQAIQHQLAVMAEHVAAARVATAAAFTAGLSTPARLPAAIAKARSSEAVTVVAPIAHAVHGAIGVTEAFDLQLFTRRLHAWRSAHGSEGYWHGVIGQAVLESTGTGVADFVRRLGAGTAPARATTG